MRGGRSYVVILTYWRLVMLVMDYLVDKLKQLDSESKFSFTKYLFSKFLFRRTLTPSNVFFFFLFFFFFCFFFFFVFFFVNNKHLFVNGLIWQIISFILPPNEYSCVYAWKHWEILRQIDLQKMPILGNKNYLFRWSLFWSWRVCKQAKLSHLGHRKPTRIHWEVDAPKTSCCLVRILT